PRAVRTDLTIDRRGVRRSPEVGRSATNHQTEGYAAGEADTMIAATEPDGGAATPRPLRRIFRRDRQLQPPAFQARFHLSQASPRSLSGWKLGDPVRPRPSRREVN